MNILIVGDEVFASTLGSKLQVSHHYTKHFIAPVNNKPNGSEIIVDIDFSDEKGIINFCIENKIDVVVLANKQLLEIGFYDKLKSSDFLNRTIIVGATQATIQQFSNSIIENNFSVSSIENMEELVVLTDGKIFKVLNEKNDQELNIIEQQIIKALKGKDVNISGFLSCKVIKHKEFYELVSLQFVISNEIAIKIFERLETDVLSLFAAMDNGTLEDVNIEFYDNLN